MFYKYTNIIEHARVYDISYILTWSAYCVDFNKTN